MNNIEEKVIKLNKSGEMGYKKDCLNVVGKLISDKEMSFKTCKNALLGMWENPQGVAVQTLEGRRYYSASKTGRKGCRSFRMDHGMLWREGVSVFEVDHDFMEFWIQVHGIPLEFMEKETACLIGEMLGVLVEAEEPKMDGVLKRPYLRIRSGSNMINHGRRYSKTRRTESGWGGTCA
ncbi:hypothetical protein Ahy_B08g090950 [Arachis hypogaea]|uniref:Uncharacterized protein n=1 Tax=Arachis hypogaea TaxID=3818 RepID=A0A444Y0X8_ARAHY|nr:hypothetical protein Ahy_B08g090950 [Arachis hypogaea]